ncbi:MAG TPA: asparagine synthase-related protein, partial [Rhodothermales bacterium]|nr:asparagine synthase-related protein [Rhodothermales bacterium]
MSWILGFAGTSLSPSLRERLVALHPLAMRVAEEATYYLAAGGLPETCHAGALPKEAGTWAVVGLGIRLHDDHCTFLDTAAWQARLSRQPPDLDSLNGHFAAVRYQHGRLDCFTDPMGTRTLYFVQLDDGVAFSTRLDWLARLRGEAAINFGVFGSHWLSFNQWSSESLVKGVQRLGPGGHATLTERGLDLTETPWLPDIDESDCDGSQFAQMLSVLVHPHCNNGRTVSLSLSGGMDSRLVLAMRREATPVRTHTFGPDALPDAHVARRIADGEGLQHQALHAPVPDADTCLSLLRHHMAATQAISPASAVVGLSHFPTLRAKGFIIIDGGMGEITRRKFLDRLLLFNRKALQAGDVDAILPYLRFHGPDFFSSETKRAMDQGFREEVASMWQAMPSPQTIGDENFLDLLRVRTVLPNFYGYEQNRLDGVIQNYMPFAQPALLRAVFQVPLSLRRKGRLVRQLIRTHHAALARYPLVKGGLTHPFWLPAFPAAVWTKLHTRMGHGYTNPTRRDFLETVKPFVLDAVHLQEVRAYAGYD